MFAFSVWLVANISDSLFLLCGTLVLFGAARRPAFLLEPNGYGMEMLFFLCAMAYLKTGQRKQNGECFLLSSPSRGRNWQFDKSVIGGVDSLLVEHPSIFKIERLQTFVY